MHTDLCTGTGFTAVLRGETTVIVDKSDKETNLPSRICYICDPGEEFCDQRRYSNPCTERFRYMHNDMISPISMPPREPEQSDQSVAPEESTVNPSRLENYAESCSDNWLMWDILWWLQKVLKA